MTAMTMPPMTTTRRALNYWAGPVQYGSAFVLALIFGFMWGNWYGVQAGIEVGLLALLFFLCAAWGIKRREQKKTDGRR